MESLRYEDHCRVEWGWALARTDFSFRVLFIGVFRDRELISWYLKTVRQFLNPIRSNSLLSPKD